MAKQTPTLTEVLKLAIESRFESFFTTLVCRVLEYNNVTQQADLQPVTLVSVPNADGQLVPETLPVLANVPVAFPRGGKWFMSYQLEAGDSVLALVASRSFEDWRDTGLDLEAEDVRVNPLSAAVCIPCNIYPTDNPILNAIGNKMTIGHDDEAKIVISQSQINLYEENAQEFVALAQKTYNEINALRSTVASLVTAYNAHVHATTVDFAPTGGPSSPASSPAAVASVAATYVKAS